MCLKISSWIFNVEGKIIIKKNCVKLIDKLKFLLLKVEMSSKECVVVLIYLLKNEFLGMFRDL